MVGDREVAYSIFDSGGYEGHEESSGNHDSVRHLITGINPFITGINPSGTRSSQLSGYGFCVNRWEEHFYCLWAAGIEGAQHDRFGAARYGLAAWDE